MEPTTTISSNGWPAGKHSIDNLVELLSKMQTTTDSRIAHEGLGTFRFTGNFVRQSHVFNIRTNDPALASRLYLAITSNREREDYSVDAKSKEDAASEYHAGLERAGIASAVSEARQEWRAMHPSRPKEVHGEPVSLELRAVLEGTSPVHRRRPRP